MPLITTDVGQLSSGKQDKSMSNIYMLTNFRTLELWLLAELYKTTISHVSKQVLTSRYVMCVYF